MSSTIAAKQKNSPGRAGDAIVIAVLSSSSSSSSRSRKDEMK